LSQSSTTKSTCPYCGVGCGVLIEHVGQRVTGMRGDPNHPANFGKLCTKGSTLHLTTGQNNRLLYPELRPARHLARQRIGWTQAIQVAAERFAAVIKTDGPDAVGFYISGQLLTEDYYVFNKLVKGLIGSNNVDTNSRLCMSSAVAAYKQTLGADAPPCAYEDFDSATCLLIAGANPAFAHPIAYRRIEAARALNPEQFVIVVDPRRTDTAASADLHLAIAPGSDIWLFNAMLRVMIEEQLIDRGYIEAHTAGFEALAGHVMQVSLAEASAVCQVSVADITLAARRFGGAPRPMSLWCQGLNQSQHGTHNGAALIALSLATGKIGKAGCGPFSLTGQPNAMGGREVGGLSNLLSAHRDLSSPSDRAEVARLWGVDAVPANPGLSAVEMFEAAADGKLKALWICCTNPAHSMPNQDRIKAALARCQFVVLQEAFSGTETAQYADLVLPASTWAEKEGCVTNSERRITHVSAAVDAPGEARADWRIAADFALMLGPMLDSRHAARMFAYQHVEDVFREHVATTAGRDLDITALNYQVLDRLGPQQWPIKFGEVSGTTRLYQDGVFPTASGKANFVVPSSALSAETPSKARPMRLLTGRVRDQWHGRSRTGGVAQLMNHAGEPRVEMAPADMLAQDLKDGELAAIEGQRGSLLLPAYGSEQLLAGHCFVAMHWGRSMLNSSGVNILMPAAYDPFSKQPELKHAVVHVRAARLPHQLVMMRTEADAAQATIMALKRNQQLTPLLDQFAFSSVTILGRERPTLVLRIGHHQPLSVSMQQRLDDVFQFEQNGGMRYRDSNNAIEKKAIIKDDHLLAIKLSGEIKASQWLRELMVDYRLVGALRRTLFAPLEELPAGTAGRGRIICNCLDVSINEIETVLKAGTDLDALQQQLRCGTSCGSCLPELRSCVARAKALPPSLLAA
jgi:assimilatory nitrate reductase catalytic subunit